MKINDYIDTIKNIVCDTALITRGDLDGDDLNRYIVRTRSIVVYILHYKMNLSYKECSEYVNHKSLTAVCNACTLIKDVCEYPKVYRPDFVNLVADCLDATDDVVNEYITDREKLAEEAYKRREQNRCIIEEKREKLFLERLNELKNRVFVNNIESVSFVLDVVSLFTDVNVDKIVSRDRTREVAFARHLTTYILTEKFHLSLMQTAKSVGLKNHTTICSSNLKIHDILTYPQMDLGNAIIAEKTINFFNEYLENRKVKK